ncbi:unnamed protein product [Chironomus riparius]|uniref:Leucine-rich repeat protein n=1 Tax=Chironomus riparius TaxID=315576 RepID=A0A9N9S5A8_9DIPT|nr:unnamed protein product [Chironomus riparius]
MRLLFLFFVFINIISHEILCGEVISGHAEERTWNRFDMNLWTFDAKSDSYIFHKNIEIYEDKSLGVKGILFNYIKNIKYLPVKVYKKFPNMVGYSAYNCSIQEIRYENFENLKELQCLDIQYNEISSIPSDTFKDLTKLKYLFLGTNLLKTIDENIFKPLKNLRTLNFFKNQIKLVPENALSSLTQLQNISFHGNAVENLNDLHFKNNNNLEWIWLSENKFGILSSTMFDHMANLKYVDLRDNLCMNKHYYSSGFPEMKEKIKTYCRAL